MQLSFNVLGALEVYADHEQVHIRGTRARAVFATLLLSPKRIVTVRQLSHAVWRGDLPATYPTQIHYCVSKLRQLLASLPLRLVTAHHGYLLEVDIGALDWVRFDSLVRAGFAALEGKDLRTASRSLRAGLDLWRGDVLEGIDAPLNPAAMARLTEQRLQAYERWLEIELTFGHHAEVIAELRALVDRHPTRETLVGQLMTALYRSGRQSDALAVFRSHREASVSSLAIEPGRYLRTLERQILNADPALLTTVSVTLPTRPNQLPRALTDFVGREQSLQEARTVLSTAHGGPAVIAISGVPGSGKTSLAVKIGHDLRHRFPAGQLYADLRGRDTATVLGGFLRALGGELVQPDWGVDELAGQFRSLLSGRRCLIVLDNARTVGEVLPLLPGDDGSAVIVASQLTLAGLAATHQIRLSALTETESLRLLTSAAGRRISADDEPDAVEITNLCGRLPLALRIAGARIGSRPHWKLSTMSDRLRLRHRRLDELSLGDADVRASLATGYEALDKTAQRCLRLLSLIDVQQIPLWAAGAVLDVGDQAAEEAIGQLLDASLLEPSDLSSPGGPRFRMHDLVNIFARERAATQDSEADRHAAIRRTLGGWLYLAEHAAIGMPSQTLSYLPTKAARWKKMNIALAASDAMAWFRAELPSLTAAARQARELGDSDLCWGLAAAAQSYCELSDAYDAGFALYHCGLESCVQSADEYGRAVMLRNLADLWTARDDSSRAQRLGWARDAAEIFARHGEHRGAADALYLCADVMRVTGRHDQAASYLEKALIHARRSAYRLGQLHVQQQLAIMRMEQGRLDEAIDRAERHLSLARTINGTRQLSIALGLIGVIERERGRYPESERALIEALAIARAAEDQVEEAYHLGRLGLVYVKADDPRADSVLDEALLVSEVHRLTFGTAVARYGKGLLALQTGRDAIRKLRSAERLFRSLKSMFWLAMTQRDLGRAYLAAQRHAAADVVLTKAKTAFAQLGNSPEVQRIESMIDSGRLGA